jgi:tetratricopeptide (TPR) repeat protein
LFLIGLFYLFSIASSFAVNAKGPIAPAKASNTYETAVSLTEKKDFNKALAVCNTLIEKKSMRSLDAMKLKIRIYEQTKCYPEALIHYDRLLRTASSQADRNEIRATMARIKALELDDPMRSCNRRAAGIRWEITTRP